MREENSARLSGFEYLPEREVYLDSACQTLRPEPVTQALEEYYREYNSCGERVKYDWGKKVDANVDATRSRILKWLKLSPREYFVSFTLNTTYGLNLILSQLKPNGFQKIITSDIEHNSPFLATMALAKRTGWPREVVTRNADGTIDLDSADFNRAVVVVNATSNIDGRCLTNVKDLVKKVHKAGGIIIIDAAQTMAHYHTLIEKTDADAVCFSAHKLYAPSLGVIVAKKSLLDNLDVSFIGGGMVDDVTKDAYQLSAGSPAHIHTVFEAGLQAWGEIIALGAALDWLVKVEKTSQVFALAERLHEFLKNQPGVHLTSDQPSTTMAFYYDKLDSHLLAEGLSTEGIMARSGYFCCHYYLDHVMGYPPLLRFSLGHHSTAADVDKTIETLGKVFK